jgi:nucleotide-binding universal stress UspA family protein
MIEIRRMLCPVDFSECSKHALHHAAAIARWYESTITLLYVHPIVPMAAAAPGAPAFPPFVVTAAEREKLLASMKSLGEHETLAGIPLEVEVAEGSAALEILDRASAPDIDLIVMGTHGRSGFERLIIGSVTERVLRKASCPVLSVPPRVQDAESLPPLFKRILCAIDFSDCSMRALHFAAALAQEAGGHLTVINVVELPADAHERLPHLSPGVREYVAALEEDHRERLQSAVPEAVRACCEVETMMVPGKPYREILRVAADQQSDLIVIGIHGGGAADRLFFGSTTQHVVRQATCPVLTLRTESDDSTRNP